MGRVLVAAIGLRVHHERSDGELTTGKLPAEMPAEAQVTGWQSKYRRDGSHGPTAIVASVHQLWHKCYSASSEQV